MATEEIAIPIPEVAHLQIKQGVVVQNCDVYIGRQCFRGGWQLKKSVWANPYTINKCSRDGAIADYREYILTKFILNPWSWASALQRLVDAKTLGCWCKPLPCHGDVLVDFLRRYVAKEKTKKMEPAKVEALAREMLEERTK